jgi:ribosomal protein S25
MNLNAITQAINKHDFNQAEIGLISILTQLHERGFSSTKVSPQGIIASTGEADIVMFANQFVMVVNALLSNNKYIPSERLVECFILAKQHVDALFVVSSWGSSDPIMENLLLDKSGKKKGMSLSGKTYSILLMLLSVSSKFKLNWQDLAQKSPLIAILNLLSMININHQVVTPKGAQGIENALKAIVEIPFENLINYQALSEKMRILVSRTISLSYFTCSNYDSDYKYTYKKWLADYTKFNLQQITNVSQYTTDKTRIEVSPERKIKVLVVLEKYSPNHAMARSYDPIFKVLSEKYELIALGAFSESIANDKTLFAPFSRVVRLDKPENVDDTMQQVKDIGADVIYYSSIGMSIWGIYLSQHRLAPLQIMSGGHPSSSLSDCVDNIIIPVYEKSIEGMQDYFTEQIIAYKDNSNKRYATIHSDVDNLGLETLSQYKEFGDGPIRVAINGVVTKVTHKLIESCKNIQNKSGRDVTFIFFTSLKGSDVVGVATKKLILSSLKGSEFYYGSNYKDYMKVLSSCHFCIPTFPFGGTNSNIDAMLLNKPKLFIKGKAQLYTRCDYLDWSEIGLDDDLGCESFEDLENRAVKFIENEELLKSVRQRIVDADILSNRFVSDSNRNTSFVELFDRCVNAKLDS